MKNPKISVCIPTYNYAKFLPVAIESVLKQSFTDFELILIDDCSQDNTAEVVKNYLAIDQRIVFKQNDRNIGMVENWNLCLKEAKGEYIRFLFADDFLTVNDALMKMVDVLDSDPSVTLVSSARNIVDEGGGLVKIGKFFNSYTKKKRNGNY